MEKNTLIIGASENPERYSNKAANMLASYNVPFQQIGLREGTVANQSILTGKPTLSEIHTVTLYIGPASPRRMDTLCSPFKTSESYF